MDFTHPVSELGKRERQIMEVIFRRGRATVAQVLSDLVDAPSYSAVRGMLRYLEDKGHLKHEQDGPRYVYLPTLPKRELRASALLHVVRTFFDGSISTTVATLLESKQVTGAEFERLSRLLEEARAGEASDDERS